MLIEASVPSQLAVNGSNRDETDFQVHALGVRRRGNYSRGYDIVSDVADVPVNPGL